MKPPDLFVPAFTTLSPTMLLRRPSRPAGFPFDSPRVRYFYFARNALWRVVRLFGLERGEVLMPAYHHGVEVGALLDAGARVRFYRVGARMETDLEDLERQIGPQTSAIHLTHFLGFPGPVREARAIADRHGVPLIEDCAHGLLTLDGGQPLGRTGHAAVFCLYKGLPVPNGGALVIHDPRIADPESPPPPPLGSTISALAVSMLRRLALRGGAAGRGLRRLALGAGKTLLRASAIEPVPTGSEQFERANVDLGISRISLRIARGQDLARARERQRSNYLFLHRELADLSPPLLPEPAPGVAPFFYPLRVADNREAARRLNQRGIEAVDVWRASHPACDLARFPEVEQLRRTVLEIPCHQDLGPATLARCVAVIRQVLGPRPAG
jgi:dTDP-4-amino-4,6-dideoxygalactose transaminase